MPVELEFGCNRNKSCHTYPNQCRVHIHTSAQRYISKHRCDKFTKPVYIIQYLKTGLSIYWLSTYNHDI